ncbi:Double-strand-break repair protein rad21-like protein 1 [Porphyridium purpureum]|uniref:Double-strand-break repair protein rad21-like protein 1 n=1 Tax=Porphyridium purpureum TaxID=35688 RepID=A0A5J4Z4M0_PORPP|nr:Double-strand-break repair protein rad21-like protein 1 [Porphyridium purpureum]|eukprot:POR1444..scf295_1
MFYSSEILTRRGPLAKVWIASCMGKEKVTKKFALEADISTLCESICAPPEPLALRLSSQLMFGVCRVYEKKCTLVLTDASESLAHLRRSKSLGIASGPGELLLGAGRRADLQARQDVITLMRPSGIANLDPEHLLDIDFFVDEMAMDGNFASTTDERATGRPTRLDRQAKKPHRYAESSLGDEEEHQIVPEGATGLHRKKVPFTANEADITLLGHQPHESRLDMDNRSSAASAALFANAADPWDAGFGMPRESLNLSEADLTEPAGFSASHGSSTTAGAGAAASPLQMSIEHQARDLQLAASKPLEGVTERTQGAEQTPVGHREPEEERANLLASKRRRVSAQHAEEPVELDAKFLRACLQSTKDITLTVDLLRVITIPPSVIPKMGMPLPLMPHNVYQMPPDSDRLHPLAAMMNMLSEALPRPAATVAHGPAATVAVVPELEFESHSPAVRSAGAEQEELLSSIETRRARSMGSEATAPDLDFTPVHSHELSVDRMRRVGREREVEAMALPARDSFEQFDPFRAEYDLPDVSPSLPVRAVPASENPAPPGAISNELLLALLDPGYSQRAGLSRTELEGDFETPNVEVETLEFELQEMTEGRPTAAGLTAPLHTGQQTVAAQILAFLKRTLVTKRDEHIFGTLASQCDRRAAARLFASMLALSAQGYVHLEQSTPYGSIRISASDALLV